jgi:hypothetical protein
LCYIGHVEMRNEAVLYGSSSGDKLCVLNVRTIGTELTVRNQSLQR